MKFQYTLDDNRASLTCSPMSVLDMANISLNLIAAIHGSLAQTGASKAEVFRAAVECGINDPDSPLWNGKVAMQNATAIVMDENAMWAWGK